MIVILLCTEVSVYLDYFGGKEVCGNFSLSISTVNCGVIMLEYEFYLFQIIILKRITKEIISTSICGISIIF